MNKILLITTGGTLACTMGENGLTPTMTGNDILKYSKHPEADITVLDCELIDSSVMTDRQRDEIADIIWENRDRYDSFVITHGTDSMSYTAAYLECALKNFDKSIIITGAQYPLGTPDTDAEDNLNLAIKTALQGYWGVCIAFADKLIPAKTAVKIDTERKDAFVSSDEKYLTAPTAKPAEQPVRNRENHSVALIYITPALTNSLLLASGDCEKIIVLALGAGGMLKSHEAVLDKLHNELGKKIYLKSQCMYGDIEALYEAHSGTKKFIPVNGSSIEWAVCAAKFDII